MRFFVAKALLRMTAVFLWVEIVEALRAGSIRDAGGLVKSGGRAAAVQKFSVRDSCAILPY
jgi:hypothetical protein